MGRSGRGVREGFVEEVTWSENWKTDYKFSRQRREERTFTLAGTAHAQVLSVYSQFEHEDTPLYPDHRAQGTGQREGCDGSVDHPVWTNPFFFLPILVPFLIFILEHFRTCRFFGAQINFTREGTGPASHGELVRVLVFGPQPWLWAHCSPQEDVVFSGLLFLHQTWLPTSGSASSLPAPSTPLLTLLEGSPP